jgi:hypothetical protein
MNNKDAFIIEPVSTTNSPNKGFSVDVSILIKQFDEILREKLGLKIKIVQPDWFDFEKCQQLIENEGITSFLSMLPINEDILGKVNDRYSMSDRLRKKLEEQSPSKELIIVDGYVFKPKKDEKPEDHLNFFIDIFSPTISNIKHIKFITHPKYNKSQYNYFKKSINELNPEITVVCNTTGEFHDRFWIIDRTKGLVIGTSLSGIGNKYALFDKLRDEDTKYLVSKLMELKLLD